MVQFLGSIPLGNELGSMIEKVHMEKVLAYIDSGKNEGAELVLGGRRILQETGGYFIEPTIFDDVVRSNIDCQ